MKLVLILSAMIMTTAAWAEDEGVSEATSASHSFDPTKEDCKCLQGKKSILPLENEQADLQVVEWIANPQAGGTPPPIGSPEATK